MPVLIKRTDPAFATTLAHGIALLEAFGIGDAALTNKQLAERSGLSKATVSRLTLTLQGRGLVLFDPQQRRYRLASGALTIGYPLLASLPLRREARPGMQQLADELGGSVSLGMRDRTRMIYVETSRGNDPIAFRPDIGASLPMLQTAMGRTWLAAAPTTARAALLDVLRRQSPQAYTIHAARLRCAVDDLERVGFCTSHGDWQPDVSAVAVALATPTGTERLVLNCGVARVGLGQHELETRVAPRLLQLARLIERFPRPDEPAAFAVSGTYAARILDDSTPARTLARGLDVLQCFQPGEQTLGHREIVRRLGLTGPTVVRLTHTLTQLGYLRRDDETSRYRLGAAVLALGYPLLANLRVRRVARSAMQAFSERFGAAVSLGFRHGAHMVYVETAWRRDDRVLAPDVGAPMPMLSTAMGRAWLCQAAPDERRSVLNRLRVLEPEAYKRHAPAVEQAFREFERSGFCSSRGDYVSDVFAFAVPLSQPIDATSFVVNCGVLGKRSSFAEATHQVALPLRDLVRDIEMKLGVGHEP